MNEHLFTNNDGLRLITQFEGAPRLKARRCEGGAWELSYGVTFYPDGSPVREGDTCTEEQAMAMFRHALQVFEEAVKRLVTVPLTSHQFSALVAFCYNIGESNMASSTVLKEVNAGRFDDAAAAFGMWVFATLDGYKQAFRGLLRRRYAEAACFLGYDWTEACADEAIALQREKPASLPGKDRVIYKTPFKDVLRVAQRYPLSPATQPAPEAKPAPALIPDTPAAPPQAAAKGDGASLATQPVSAPPAPEQKPAASTSSGPSRDVAAPEAPKAAAPAKVPPAIIPVPPVVAGTDGAKPKSPNTTAPADVPYKIDPNAGLKPLEESERAKGYVVQQVGIGIIRLGSLGVFGTTIQGGAQVVQGDPVLSNIILMGFVAGGIAVVGYVVATYGAWKKKRGEQRASQGLF